MTDLDQLADFLLARAQEPGVSAVDRGKTEGIVQAWREGIAPAETESAMRMVGTVFTTHPDYREVWKP